MHEPSTHPAAGAPARAADGAPVTVLGVGSTLRSDDGVGVHVLAELTDRVHADVTLVDGGTLSFSLLETIAGTDGLIVIDAAKLGAAPGTVQVFAGTDMDRFLNRRGAVSVHEVSIAELMDMARLRDELPGRRALVAIEPDELDWGSRPGTAGATALPLAAQAVVELIEAWRP